MEEFWRNPELVRHVRAELRPLRALTAALVVLVIAALIALSCYGAEHDNQKEYFRLFYIWLAWAQGVVLALWTISSCSQAISGERQHKTYDFLKTTRLTSEEILIGKLLGAPILGYFTVGCSLPISLIAGLLGGYSLSTLLLTYLLIVVFALVLGLASLELSMLGEKTSGGVLVLAFLLLYPMLMIGFAFMESPFPGLGAASILPAIFGLYGFQEYGRIGTPLFFGFHVSYVFLSLFLYCTFGAWFVLMLRRNLKKELEEVRLLSRGQALAFAAYINLLMYAFLDFNSKYKITPTEVGSVALVVNACILLLVGLATLTPHEQLKMWWRRRAAGQASYFSSDGLPWPWLVLTAVGAYLFMLGAALALHRSAPLAQWPWKVMALELTTVLVYIVSAVLFLQFCNLTRMKRPILKGVLYLMLYYTAAGIAAGVLGMGSDLRARQILSLLTPFPAVNWNELAVPGWVYAGLAIQVAVTAYILSAISKRLRRPALAPAHGDD
ncbi:MAG TPA: hypothetical protein VEG08_06775 [Terriglobales bacterium]|nr:hypothetical protein [Terriglobales bacterium]